MWLEEPCPQCGHLLRRFQHPVPAVDLLLEYHDQGLVLIERAKPPYGWALPGGLVEYGESLEAAARRKAWEETGLEVVLLGQFQTYSGPHRDPRQHIISTVFVARGFGSPQAGDDARGLGIFPIESLPENLAFDHAQILADYLAAREKWLMVDT